MNHDLVVIFEHPQWQQPLFAALDRRNLEYGTFDLKNGAFDPDAVPEAPLYFNQASPSAYVRGNTRAVPLALSFIRSLEIKGARVLNGSKAFALELSKSTQAALMQKLNIAHPRTLVFNDVEVALARWGNCWPTLLKPEQGGSGARMYLLYSADELRTLLNERPELWLPDNLLLLQEYFEVDPAAGIVRMEFLGGEFLYAMRVVSHGSFNLCPSETCNPEDGASMCELPENPTSAPVEFYPYPEVPNAAIESGQALMKAGGLDVGGVEYLEAKDGRLLFYDLNANSNLREPIARSFGFNPFDRVAEFLSSQFTSLAKG